MSSFHREGFPIILCVGLNDQYLITWLPGLLVIDCSVGNRREHGGDRVLVTNEVAEKLVEDGRHGVSEDLPVIHAFLLEREREREMGIKSTF